MRFPEWLHDFFVRAGKGILGMHPERMFRPGLYAALPTAAATFDGAIARKSDGVYVCQATSGTYFWDLVNGPAILTLTDGVTAPTAVVGKAFLYVDTADGDLKVRFGDNVTKTIATDT